MYTSRYALDEDGAMISLFQMFLPFEMLIDTIKGKAGQDWKWLPKNKETIGRRVEKRSLNCGDFYLVLLERGGGGS